MSYPPHAQQPPAGPPQHYGPPQPQGPPPPAPGWGQWQGQQPQWGQRGYAPVQQQAPPQGHAPPQPPPNNGAGEAPPADVAQLAAQYQLGGFVRSHTPAGPLAGVLTAFGTLAAVILIEVALIAFAGVYVVGGILFFGVIYAFIFMFKTFFRTGTAVHLFTHGLVKTDSGHPFPVHFGQVYRMRKNREDHYLHMANGSEVKLPAFLSDEKELFGHVAKCVSG